MVHSSLFIDNSKSSIILERSGNPLGELPIMSIENPTLALVGAEPAAARHFRHFIRRGGFSSLFTNLSSTSVENPLQISSFYAKQTQFPKSQMNVNLYNTRDYENKPNWTLGENKPNSNPIKACPERSRMGQF